MVGFETSDDAAVFRMTDEVAALLSVDFFTPIVDDPFDFGRIAAANALSDIYAMGGVPLAAMNLLAFPCGIGPGVVAEVLRGGAEKVREAGAVVVGGHTIDDAEPKYGLAVMGSAHPDEVVTNAGARAGDRLVLTKPVGTGVLTTALKRGLETEGSIREVVESMARLNRGASEAMRDAGARAATDVTGFGLLGHAREMAEASGVSVRVETAAVPLFEGVHTYAADGVCPGRTADVVAFLDPHVEWGPADETWKRVLADPQTSGGLLIAVPETTVEKLLAGLASRGEAGWVVGEMLAGEPGDVTIA
jgi:selenide,water dikinase